MNFNDPFKHYKHWFTERGRGGASILQFVNNAAKFASCSIDSCPLPLRISLNAPVSELSLMYNYRHLPGTIPSTPTTTARPPSSRCTSARLRWSTQLIRWQHPQYQSPATDPTFGEKFLVAAAAAAVPLRAPQVHHLVAHGLAQVAGVPVALVGQALAQALHHHRHHHHHHPPLFYRVDPVPGVVLPHLQAPQRANAYVSAQAAPQAVLVARQAVQVARQVVLAAHQAAGVIISFTFVIV